MSVNEYRTIAASCEGMFKDRGSSFPSFCFPVSSESEIKTHLAAVKKLHFKCNHHCYAFRLHPDGSVYRSSDDREPSGSAGKPILGVLLSHQLTDTLIIVARYFGGSLLGVPGLIHAYRSAAEDAVANGTIITRTVDVKVSLTFPFELLNEVMMLLKSLRSKTENEDYGSAVNMTVSLSVSDYEILSEKISSHPNGYQVELKLI